MKIAKYHRATTCLPQPHFDANISQSIQVYCSRNKTDLFCCWKKKFFFQIAEDKITTLGNERDLEACDVLFSPGRFLLWEPLHLDALPVLIYTHLTPHGGRHVNHGVLSLLWNAVYELVYGLRVEMQKSVTAVGVCFAALSQNH